MVQVTLCSLDTSLFNSFSFSSTQIFSSTFFLSGKRSAGYSFLGCRLISTTGHLSSGKLIYSGPLHHLELWIKSVEDCRNFEQGSARLSSDRTSNIFTSIPFSLSSWRLALIELYLFPLNTSFGRWSFSNCNWVHSLSPNILQILTVFKTLTILVATCTARSIADSSIRGTVSEATLDFAYNSFDCRSPDSVIQTPKQTTA